MKKKRFITEFILACFAWFFVVIALLVGIMIYAVSSAGYSISAVSIFHTITAPIQQASNMLSERVEHSLNVYRDAEAHYEQNKALKEEVAELNRELADYEETKRKLEELQAALTHLFQRQYKKTNETEC